jgi:hypothetical protein
MVYLIHLKGVAGRIVLYCTEVALNACPVPDGAV